MNYYNKWEKILLHQMRQDLFILSIFVSIRLRYDFSFCTQIDMITSAKGDLCPRKNIPLPPHMQKRKVEKVSTALRF